MTTETSTHDLIARLCKSQEKRTILGSPLLRTLCFVVLVLLYNALFVSLGGVRGDLIRALSRTDFLFEITLSFLISVTACLSLSLLMIPDMRGHKWVISIPMTLLGVFGVWIGLEFFAQGHVYEHVFPNDHCLKDGLMYAGLPIAFITFWVRKGATTHPRWTTLMAVLSVSFMGWISLRFVCSLDTSSHIFINHFLPFIVIGFVFGLLGRRLFSW